MKEREEGQFHKISLDEYDKQRANTQGRITPEDLASGFLVATGYTTNTSLARREGALRFTAGIEVLTPAEASTVGAIGIKLIIYSGLDTLNQNTVERLADAYPHAHEEAQPAVWWVISGAYPIRLPQYSNAFREGFLVRWSDNDASDPGWYTEEDLPRELRQPPLF